MSLEYFYNLGLSVIPCSGKRPIVENWQIGNQTRPTEEQIEEWDEKYPGCNVGLCVGPASGIIALDVDIADEKIHNDLAPHTTLRRHGRPGRMMYFYRWNGEEGKKVLGGVEIYYSTGQVIIDGTHPDTNLPYTLLVPGDLSLQEAIEMLPDFPADAERAIKEHLDKMPKEEKERKTGGGIMGVGRNASLTAMSYQEACYMLASVPPKDDKQIAQDLLDSEWGSWFTDKSEPHGGRDPFGAALTMARRAIAKAESNGHIVNPNDFEEAIAEWELEQKMKEEKVSVVGEGDFDRKSLDYKKRVAESNRRANEAAYKKAKMPPIPEEGLIRDIVEASEGYYTEVTPVALAGALFAMSQLCTRRFFTGGHAASDYFFIIAPSGSGKGFAHDVIADRLLRDVPSLDDGLEFGQPKSIPAIYMQLKENRYLSYVLKESEGFLAGLKTTKGNTSNDVGQAVLALWDSTWINKPVFANNISKSNMMDKGGGIGKISYPFLNLLCCTTVSQFKNMASPDTLRNGLFSRFMVFPQLYTKRNFDMTEKEVVDKQWDALKKNFSAIARDHEPEKCQGLDDVMDDIALGRQQHIPIEIPTWDSNLARRLIDPDCDDIMCIADEDPRSGLAARFEQHVMRMALLYCVSELKERVVLDDSYHEYNGFRFRRAKTVRIMPKHIEWARKLFFWMLDEVQDLFEEIEFMDEKNSYMLSNEKALSAIDYIKKVVNISWREISRKRSLNIKHQADFIRIARDHGIYVTETPNKNGSKSVSFTYKGE